MNTIGKILVVFVTASSLGFLAFVIALTYGGPNWKGEMRSEDLQKEFVFTAEPGEKVRYTSKHRRTDSSVVDKTPVLAEAVVKSRKRLEEDANKKFQELSGRVQPLTDLLALIKKLIPEDDAGVQARITNFDAYVQQLVVALKDVGNQFSATTLETQDVLRVAQERREEGYRLSNQLELLRNDKFAALQQQKVLEDRLIRLEENRARLQRRQKTLKTQLGDIDDYENSQVPAE
jgi:hypothetical protein